MGFSEYLANNKNKKYQDKYLEYDAIITAINNGHDGVEDYIHSEFEKIFSFIKDQTNKFREALISYEKNSEGRNKEIFDLLQEDMKEFAEFIRITIIGFKKILKHHDKKSSIKLETKYKTILKEKLEAINHLDELIYSGSRLKLKEMDINTTSNTNLVFVRKTNKYWVHIDNLMALKLSIVKNLPLYVFTNEKGQTPYSAWNHKTHDTCVTSVYFDNDDFYIYDGRLKKNEGAEAIRIRWYGTISKETDIVFIERKKHCEGWTGEESKKLRFKIEEKYVNDFIQGKDVWKHVSRLNGKEIKYLYDEIQGAIVKHTLKPKIRTFYKRISFQIPNDSTIRLSLDTNLCMIKENGENWRRTDIMCEWPFRQLEDTEIVRFPHAILEVKTQGIDESKPTWLEDILNSTYVEHVYKFSKFLHGIAILYNVKDIPYWLPQMKTDIRKDPFINIRNRKKFNNDELILVSSQTDCCKSIELTNSIESNNLKFDNRTNNNNNTDFRISIPVRVEPKVFFANERTFLSWVQFAIFLGGIGTAMLGLENYKANLCGSLLIGVAIIFALYALHLFFWRAERIRQKDPGPYDDTKGPLILVGVFILALLFSVYFKFPMKKKYE